MSRFRQLILEAFEELEEAPKKSNIPFKGFYLKASGSAFRKYAGQDFYFQRFEMQQDGTQRPIFYPEEGKQFAKLFKSINEAEQTLDTIYKNAPIYKQIFQSIRPVTDTGGEIVPKDKYYEPETSTTDNTKPIENQEQEQQPSKFKQFLTQQKDNIKNMFQTAKTSTKELTDTVSKVLNGQSTGNAKIDQAVMNLKNLVNQSKQAVNKAATKFNK